MTVGGRKVWVTRCPLDQRQELRQVRRWHDHDLAAEGHDREAQNAGRVGERGQREIDGPAKERIAHQRQRRHRLDAAAGQHHALGPAGGPAGSGDQGGVIGRIRLPGLVRQAVEPVGERHGPGRPLVKADQRGEPGQVRRYLLDERRERALEDQAGAVDQVE
jgi:hypothetical protein